MRSDMYHTVLPANYTMPAFTPHRPLAGTHFTVPRTVEGWVDLGGWLHAEIKCCLRESNPYTVIHPGTNRAQRRLTSLIDITTTPRRHPSSYNIRTEMLLYGGCVACCLPSPGALRRVCAARPINVSKKTGETDGRTDGRQNVTLCLPLDTATVIMSAWCIFWLHASVQ